MPTEYTANIKDGITFEQYAMQCARAFGALIMMRDEETGAEIPEKFEPDKHHYKAFLKACGDITALNAMSADEAEQRAGEAWEEGEANRVDRLAENTETIRSYKAMLSKAQAWKPPSEVHEGLHTFMCEQLEKSIEFDDPEEFYMSPAPRLTGEQWLAEAIAKAQHNIEYHKKGNEEEIARTDERNLWISKLRESLNT